VKIALHASLVIEIGSDELASEPRLADLPEERRRLLSLPARSAAVLRLGDERIQELEKLQLAVDDKDEGRRLAARQKFLGRLWLVRRMASRQLICEVVDGAHYPMFPPTAVTDPRIEAIAWLARKLGLADSDVDAETSRVLEEQERDRAKSEAQLAELMAKLPPSRARYEQPAQGELPSGRRRVNYDDTALREIVSILPSSRPSLVEQRELEECLLGDLGDHLLQCEAMIDGPQAPSIEDTPIRRTALLRAACDKFDEVDAERARSLKRKSEVLRKEFPKGAGDGVKYSARNNDLEGELLQPLQETLSRLRGKIIRLAIHVRPVNTWPSGNSRSYDAKFERALALGRSLSVGEADLALARASLGYAQLDRVQEELVG
jgi:hypothetical protein